MNVPDNTTFGNVRICMLKGEKGDGVEAMESAIETERNERVAADDALRSAIGTPLKASTAAQMTNTSKIYVYTGSESGYTAGHWYYYTGSAWADGGVYNSTAFETDKTLAVADMAADAKETGDQITDLKSALKDVDLFIENGNVSNLGEENDDTNRLRTGYIYFEEYPITVAVKEGYGFLIRSFNKDFSFRAAVSGFKTTYTFNNPNIFIRFVFAYPTSEYPLEPGDITNIFDTGWDKAKIVIPLKQLKTKVVENKTVIDDLNRKSKALETSIIDITGNTIIPITGYYKAIDLSGQIGSVVDLDNPLPSNIFKYSVYECNGNEMLTVSGTYGTAPKAIGFLDSDKKIIRIIDGIIDKYEVTTPLNCKYVVINSTISDNKESYVGQLISRKVSDIQYELEQITGNSIIPITRYNALIDLSGSIADVNNPRNSPFSNYSIIPCAPGDKFTITGTTGTFARAYAFTDANYNILEKAQNINLLNAKVIAPEGSAYLINDILANTNSRSFYGHIVSDILYDLEKYGLGLEEIIFNYGSYIISNTSPVSDLTPIPRTEPMWWCAVVDCVEGDRFLINGNGGATPRLWCFIDTNGKILDVSSSGALLSMGIIIAPSNSSKLIINQQSSLKPCYKIQNASVATSNYDDYNLNINLYGLQDMCWEFQNWVFPQVVSCKRYRDQLLFGFLTGDAPRNYTGIASYDFATKEVKKTLLKKNPSKDDHDLLAVIVLSTGKILCAYTDGHNNGKHIFVRISTQQESIDRFEEVIVVQLTYNTSYVQIFEYDDKLYMFTRQIINTNSWRWAYVVSEDFGETWGEEQVLITADMQYYVQLTETNTAGTLMILCYSNPTLEQSDIRCGYVHLDTMTVYQKDDTSLVGIAPVDYHNINIAASHAEGYKLRLYNGLKANVGDVKFLYNEFDNVKDNGMYKLYDNGTVVNICESGVNVLLKYVQPGIAWINASQIVVAYGSGGHDYLDIFSYDSINHTATKIKTIDSHDRANSTRMARPMVDVNGRALVYWKGYFDKNSYTNFFTDGRFYLLDQESE